MDNFQIETAQNIGIDQIVAGIGDRILAFIIDMLIITAYIVLIFIGISGLELDSQDMWVYYLVIGLPIFLYFLLWETFNSGQTPGKAAMEIRVVRLDGARPRFSQYMVRWLLRIIDISLSSGGVAVVTILLNGKGQRLGDLAAGTTVITEKKQMRLSQTLLEEVSEDYTPSYPQVTILRDRDIQNIKQIFNNALRQGNNNIIVSLSQKVADLLEVQPKEYPMEFIRKVLKDYNYYTQQ